MKKPVSLLEVIYYIVLLMLFIVLHLNLLPYATDDAYTHFRISRNLIEYGTPYFNPDEPVMAGSSTVWTVLLAIPVASGIDPQSAATGINILVLLFLAISTLRMATDYYRLSLPAGMLISFITISAALTASLQLMESVLALFLIMAGMLMLTVRRVAGFSLLATAVFVRLELSVVLIIVAGYNMFFPAVDRKKSFLAIASGILPWMLFNFYYFGTNIPQTVRAKKLVYNLTPANTFSLVVADFFGLELLSYAPLAAFMIPIVGLIFIVASRFERKRKVMPAAPLLMFSGFLIMIAYIVNTVFIFPWYSPLYTVPFLTGLLLYCFSNGSALAKTGAVLICLPVLVSAGFDFLSLKSPNYFTEYEGGAKARRYLEAGTKIFQCYPDKTLMASEIGALGYAFKGKIKDAVGLASPEALKHYPRGKAMTGGIPPEFVIAAKPDLIAGIEYHTQELMGPAITDNFIVKEIDMFTPDDRKLIGSQTYLHSSKLRILINNSIIPGCPGLDKLQD